MQETHPSSNPDRRSLHNTYGKVFRNFNLHHIIPGSRRGGSSEFNLFPFFIKAHRAWHFLFYNLTIMEAWVNFDSIYNSIFDTDEEIVKMKWLLDCRLESQKSSRATEDFNRNINRLAIEGVSVNRLRQKWFVCFGGTDRHQARVVMKTMMLVMIFGQNVVNEDWLFDNGNIGKVIDNLPAAGPRAWAFENCFKSSDAKLRRVKAMTRKILESYPHY